MKGYVVTLFNLPQSIEVANRCVKTAKKFDIDVELFPAVYKDIARQEATNDNIKLGKWNPIYSDDEAVIGNLVSQHRIWTKIANGTEPGIVLEHDAVFVSEVPDLEGKGDIINLGKPSHCRIRHHNEPGIRKMVQSYLQGAHGYYLTPKGASALLAKVKQIGAMPCDLFICKRHFPNIQEAYPWPIEAHDTFTTIQKERGCIQKHSYNDDYEIL